MNIPNFLSLIRIILIPITARLFYIGKIETAAAVFVAACLTDILDGYIARHFNMVTDLGKILDPLADKGMQLTVLISMATCGLMPKAVVIMILCKEVIQVVGGSILYKLGVVISAKASGKACYVCVRGVAHSFSRGAVLRDNGCSAMAAGAFCGACVFKISVFLYKCEEDAVRLQNERANLHNTADGSDGREPRLCFVHN